MNTKGMTYKQAMIEAAKRRGTDKTRKLAFDMQKPIERVEDNKSCTKPTEKK